MGVKIMCVLGHVLCLRRVGLFEGMQPKVGGKLHLKLNTELNTGTRPIVNSPWPCPSTSV